jgi:putative cell wall-binding protein
MKSFLVLLTGVLIILTSCSTQYQTRNYDDVYYSPKRAVVEKDIVVVKNNNEPEVKVAEEVAVAPEQE